MNCKYNQYQEIAFFNNLNSDNISKNCLWAMNIPVQSYMKWPWKRTGTIKLINQCLTVKKLASLKSLHTPNNIESNFCKAFASQICIDSKTYLHQNAVWYCNLRQESVGGNHGGMNYVHYKD